MSNNHKRVTERFRDRVVVADGATGSELLTRLPAGARLDLAAIEYPRQVQEIHLAYLTAGAEVLETASFAASRPRLAHFQAEDQVEEVNSAAVKLAREAREIAGVDCLIAGSIGPLAGVVDFDEPDGPTIIAAAHAEQAAALAGRGADLLILETFFRLDELELAIGAVRKITDLPIIAMLTFPQENVSDTLNEHVMAVQRLFDLGIFGAGVNCAPGPQGALEILEGIPDPKGVLAAMPNAGMLVRRDGRIFMPPATPSYLAGFAQRAAALGVGFIGGCCGTGPEHIKAIAAAVKGLLPTRSRSTVDISGPLISVPVAPRGLQSSLATKLAAKQFVNVVQLDPPKGTNADRLLDAARMLAADGRIDAMDINSNPLARLRMDSLWLASEVQRETGMETIPHITPRDASLMGLQSQLLGAWRAGLRNLLAISGDPSQLGDYPGVHDVYHVDIFELVRAVSRMAEGYDCAGNPVGEPPAFCLGVAVNPAADSLVHEIDRMKRKVDSGAHYIMSQVFFDWAPWERFIDACGGSLPLPALVAIWPLTSLKLALRLHYEVPGIFVPDDLIQKLEASGAEASKVGMETAQRLLRQAPDYAAGAYLIAPFRNPEEVLRLFEA